MCEFIVMYMSKVHVPDSIISKSLEQNVKCAFVCTQKIGMDIDI